MKMDRRQFLAATMAGAGGMLLGRQTPVEAAPAAAPAAPACAGPFDLVPLGKTGLKVCRTGFGTGMNGGNRQSNQTRMGKEAFEKLINEAYDRGVRLFDMADLYGTHEFVGRVLKAKRDQCVFVSKMWTGAKGLPEAERPDADVVVDRFRKELQTDYIDVVQIHCMTKPTWPDDQKKQMDILTGLKAKGIVRAVGISCHSVAAIEAAAACPWCDAVHVRINAYGDKMDGAPELVVPAIKKLHDAGKGVIGMKIMGMGAYRDAPEKRDGSLKFVMGLGTVDAMVVGFEKAAEIDDFATRLAAVLKAKA